MAKQLTKLTMVKYPTVFILSKKAIFLSKAFWDTLGKRKM